MLEQYVINELMNAYTFSLFHPSYHMNTNSYDIGIPDIGMDRLV